MRTLFAAMLTLLVALAGAQDVRPMTSSPSFVRSNYAQAQKEGRDWPNLGDGDDGTVVHFSADGDDADMIVTSSADEDRVFDAVRRAALDAGLPKTDYLRRHGTVTASADAEFNDYLRVEGRDTRFSFPLARLMRSLGASRLPKPLVVSIEREGRSARLVGPRGERDLPLGTTLLSAKEIEGYDRLETHFHLEWWAPLAALVLFGFPVLMVLSVPVVLLRVLGRTPAKPPATPEEAQAAYDAQAAKPWWQRANVALYAPMLFVFPLMATQHHGDFGAQAGSALPGWAKAVVESPFMFVGAILVPVVVMAPVFVVLRRRRREAETETKVPNGPNPLAGMWPVFAVLPIMLTLLVAVKLKPDLLRGIPREYVRVGLVGLPLVGFAASMFLTFRRSRDASRRLPDDDPVARDARELGARAGVRVRRVVERKEGGANAFATLFGTVGITAKLRETLDEDEIRAVMAHEIGHLKAADPARFLALSLPPTVALYALWWWAETRTPLGDNALAHFALQMSFWFGLPALFGWALSPRRRRAEHAADLFALEQTGDADLVARALVKIHDANLAPHRLHPRDERVASHPALEKRLARLREADRARRA